MIGGTIFVRGKQVEAVVADHNMREVAEAVGATLYYVREMRRETGHEQNIKLTMKQLFKLAVASKIGGVKGP